MFAIVEQLLPPGRDTNRPGTVLQPQGIVIHETDDAGATAADERAYFGRAYRGASAHYFVDHSVILRIIPETERAWHAGPTANSRYISIEMCHFDDPAQFDAVWARTVWLAADICWRHGWDPATAIVTHDWVSRQWHETDHADPTAYLAAHGRTIELFREEVRQAMQTNIGFIDTAGHWAEGEIQYAAQIGIVRGDPSGRFRPADKPSRAEVVVMIVRAVRFLLVEIPRLIKGA
jgi:N-acetylmuramoyl-L-alanine amidase